MICKHCGSSFVSFGSDVCPYCGLSNPPTNEQIYGSLFSPLPQSKGIDRSLKHDSDDWNYYDNCSDREYDDDEDYDDV